MTDISIVDGAVNLAISGDRQKLLVLHDKFKFRPPRFFCHPQYIIWKQVRASEVKNNVPFSNKGWDGWKRPGKLLSSNMLVLGRGWLDDVLQVCEVEGWAVDRSKMIVNPYKDVQADDIPDDIIKGSRHLEQWELQKVVIASLLRAGCGRVKVTVSGGKTAILCSFAAMVKKYRPKMRVLYVTPNERLVSQSAREARKFLPGWDVGQYGGDSRELDAKDMVVATSAVLNVNMQKLVKDKWFNNFVAIMCDECQYSASKSQQSILTATKAWFRVGVSDTTKELDPVKNSILTGSFGRVLNETITAGDLIELGQIAKPTITVVRIESCEGEYDSLSHLPAIGTGGWALSDGAWSKGTYEGQAFQLDEEGEFKLDDKGNNIPIPGKCFFSSEEGVSLMDMKWCLLERKYDQAIIRCKARNKYISSTCKDWQLSGKRSLVIVTRTIHVKIIEAELLKTCDPDLVRVLYGVHTIDERDEAFDWLRSTKGAILISPLVKVGTSINEIECGIVADYVADHELANQFIGRFIRKKFHGVSNTADIRWFLELQHKHYAEGSENVIEKLKAIDGYEFEEDYA